MITYTEYIPSCIWGEVKSRGVDQVRKEEATVSQSDDVGSIVTLCVKPVHQHRHRKCIYVYISSAFQYSTLRKSKVMGKLESYLLDEVISTYLSAHHLYTF